MAIGIDELEEKLNVKGEPVVFLGDAVPVQRAYLEEFLKVDHIFAPAHMNRQRAAAVGTLGVSYYKKGLTETAAEHRPDYLRLSQAERERAEREKAAKGC